MYITELNSNIGDVNLRMALKHSIATAYNQLVIDEDSVKEEYKDIIKEWYTDSVK